MSQYPTPHTKWIITGIALSAFLIASVTFAWNDPIQSPPSEAPLLTTGRIGLSRDNIGIGTGFPLSTTTIAGNLAVGANFISTLLSRNSIAIQGNLGVGTSAPAAKLDVANGGITIGNMLTVGSWNSRIPIANQPYALVGQGGRVVGMTIGSDGLPFITYYEGDGLAFKAVKCRTNTCDPTSLDVSQIDDQGNVGNPSAIVIGPDGFPIIGYNFLHSSGSIGARIAKCMNLSCSAGNFITTTLDNSALNPAILIRPNGLPIIFFYKRSTQEIVARRCNNLDCSVFNAPDKALDVFAIPSSVHNPATTISGAVGADGYPIVVYYHDCLAISGNCASATRDLRVVKCLDEDCVNVTSPVSLGPTQFQSGIHNAMTIGSDGLPFVVMTAGTGDTVAIKCNVSNCSDVSQSVLNNGALWQAVAMGSDGFPVIASFISGGGGSLAITKCSNQSCSLFSKQLPVNGVDSAGGVSIGIGADGLPITGYKSAGSPTILRCGNPFCLNYWAQR